MLSSLTSKPNLLDRVTSALRAAGRVDLVKEIGQSIEKDILTSSEAASILGVSSPNTVKNWLNGGHFPGAFKTAGGHWRFPRNEVETVKLQMEKLRHKNECNDLTPWECEEDTLPLF